MAVGGLIFPGDDLRKDLFDPEGVYEAIRKHYPNFRMRYEVDPVRQAIADSWPNKMDDVCARKEWGWTPSYNLESMTKDMLKHLREKLLPKG